MFCILNTSFYTINSSLYTINTSLYTINRNLYTINTSFCTINTRLLTLNGYKYALRLSKPITREKITAVGVIKLGFARKFRKLRRKRIAADKKAV